MLQKNKLSRNQTGFSLIELMVAVAILALVAIGLFQAFSVAFQSMSDSKDRTVATNYAQQLLEDYKNTPFEKIRPFSGPIEGTKYFQNVSVQMVNENLKKVIAQIVWGDRNDKNKNIIVDTLIGNTQTTTTTTEAGAIPAGIIIYADRYNLLPGTDDRAEPSHIYTEIVDKSGDIITDWDESNIYFEIESVIDLEGESKYISYLGNLRNYSVPPVKGIAETYFDQYEGEEREGFVKIKATLTVGEIELYDVLTLKVTSDAVAIILTADKDKISTRGEGEEKSAHLTARIVDAGGDTVNTDREINFAIVSGPGSLQNMINTTKGVAYVDLIAGTISGTATVMATSTLLEPAVIDIQIVDPGKNNIKVEVADRTIAQKGSTEITAYLTDYLGNAVSGETINFSIDNSDLGYLSSDEGITTDSNGKAVITLTLNHAGAVKVTASWIAEDETEVSDTVSVLCRSHNLDVWSEPTTIREGNSAIIYAELKDFKDNCVVGETISFSISQGNGYFKNNQQTISSSTNDSGIASTALTINPCSTENGITTVLAKWDYDSEVLGEVDIICTTAPIYEVNISANKTTISTGETVNITATVTENGSPASGIEVTFSLNDYTNAKLDGSSSSVTKNTEGDGKATVVLSDLPVGASVIVTAKAGGDSDSIKISCETTPIVIELAENPPPRHGSDNKGNRKIYFPIKVWNDSIDLRQMNIAWKPSGNEKLSELWIDDTQVYSNTSGATNGSTIQFNLSPYFTLEKNNSYEIKMIFKNDVINKNWTITFINPTTKEAILPLITFTLN